jgi:hypothetical protein
MEKGPLLQDPVSRDMTVEVFSMPRLDFHPSRFCIKHQKVAKASLILPWLDLAPTLSLEGDELHRDPNKYYYNTNRAPASTPANAHCIPPTREPDITALRQLDRPLCRSM